MRKNTGGLLPAAADAFLEILGEPRLGPDGNAVLALLDVEHDAGDVVALLRAEALAYHCQESVHPILVQLLLVGCRDGETPLAASLVLGILPFGFDAVFEEVVCVVTRKF